MLQVSSNSLDRLVGLFFSALGNNKAAERQLSVLSQQMALAMAEATGEAVVSGMKIMSKNGSMIAIAAYASGNVGLGLIIDGSVVACDITLAYNDYQKKKNKEEFITELAVIATKTVIGASTAKAAKAFSGLGEVELMKRLEPMIADLISTGVNEVLHFPEN
jgi:hypothetical protein